MGKTRRRYSKEFKAEVAIEAIKEHKTLIELFGRVWSSSESDITPEKRAYGKSLRNI